MSLPPQNHIVTSKIVDAPIDYEWGDPWDFQFEVPRLENRILPLSSRAMFALAIGFTEWVVWRAKKHTQDPLFVNFIEACWVSMLDRRYLNHTSTEFGNSVREVYKISSKTLHTDDFWDYKKDLCDRVRGPLFVAIHTLGEIADRTQPDDCGLRETIYLSNLVEQVTRESDAFKTWRRGAIGRMVKFYSEDREGNFLGEPVPREALDLEFEFHPKDSGRLLKEFLQNIDNTRNAFLVSPEQLRKLGFRGTPYQTE